MRALRHLGHSPGLGQGRRPAGVPAPPQTVRRLQPPPRRRDARPPLRPSVGPSVAPSRPRPQPQSITAHDGREPGGRADVVRRDGTDAAGGRPPSQPSPEQTSARRDTTRHDRYNVFTLRGQGRSAVSDGRAGLRAVGRGAEEASSFSGKTPGVPAAAPHRSAPREESYKYATGGRGGRWLERNRASCVRAKERERERERKRRWPRGEGEGDRASGRGAPEIDREPGRARGPGFRIRVQGQGQQRARPRVARSEPVDIASAFEWYPYLHGL